MTSGKERRAAGWYQDPEDPTRVRHWTGRSWTNRRRAHPGWHLVQLDVSPDPGWANCGGATRRGLVSDAFRPDQPALDHPGRDHPALDDSQLDRAGFAEPFDDSAVDRPLRAEHPGRDGIFHTEPYRPRSAWAAASSFDGTPMPWDPTEAGGPGARRPGFPPVWAGPMAGGSVPFGARRPARVPLIVVVGVTLFAVLVLLVNLGTGARSRFSTVQIDSAFVTRANAACTNAVRSRPGPLGVTRNALDDSARLEGLVTTLGQLSVTPAARPEVKQWVSDWRQYVVAEGAVTRADAAHDRSAAAADATTASRLATEADTFAIDNNLTGCTLTVNPDRGLETIP